MLKHSFTKSLFALVLLSNIIFCPLALAGEAEPVSADEHVQSIQLNEYWTLETEIDNKIKLYEERKKDPKYYRQLNLIPFGMGSRALGDDTAGLFISLADTFALLGLALAGAALFSHFDSENNTGWGLIGSSIWLSTAATSYGFGRLIGIYSVEKYTKIHNDKLREELGLSQQQIQQSKRRISPLFSYSMSF